MKVKIQTMLGDIVVRLYDETPIHCDNFVKLGKSMAKKSKPQKLERDIDKAFKVIGTLEHSIDYGYDHRIMSHKALASMSDAQIERTIKRAQTMTAKQKEKRKTRQK